MRNAPSSGFSCEPVREARLTFLDPAAQDPVDGRPADPHVGGYGLDAPAVQVQRHHRPPRLPHVFGLVVGLEEARELEWDDLLREDPARGVLAKPFPGADVDDVGDLVVVELRVLGLELHDHPADGRLKAAAPGTRGGRIGCEEAHHAVFLEAIDPAVHGPRRDADLPGPLRHGTAEKYQRPQFLICFLLRPLEERQQELPVVVRFSLRAFAAAHLSPRRASVGAEECHNDGPAAS
jgi:hypothetical protein